MEEIWKDVKGYEGLYQVSNLGRVKSLPKLRRNKNGMAMFKEHLLKQNIDKGGYHKIDLHMDGKRKTFFVHRLVYETFVSEIPDGMQVNHISECKDNNAISNLNLLTPRENLNYGTRNQRCSKKVVMDGNVEFDSITKTAEYLGCWPSNVSACCRNKVHTLFGHTFRYK